MAYHRTKASAELTPLVNFSALPVAAAVAVATAAVVATVVEVVAAAVAVTVQLTTFRARAASF